MDSVVQEVEQHMVRVSSLGLLNCRASAVRHVLSPAPSPQAGQCHTCTGARAPATPRFCLYMTRLHCNQRRLGAVFWMGFVLTS